MFRLQYQVNIFYLYSVLIYNKLYIHILSFYMLTVYISDIHTTIATYTMIKSTLTAVTPGDHSQKPIDIKHIPWYS